MLPIPARMFMDTITIRETVSTHPHLRVTTLTLLRPPHHRIRITTQVQQDVVRAQGTTLTQLMTTVPVVQIRPIYSQKPAAHLLIGSANIRIFS